MPVKVYCSVRSGSSVGYPYTGSVVQMPEPIIPIPTQAIRNMPLCASFTGFRIWYTPKSKASISMPDRMKFSVCIQPNSPKARALTGCFMGLYPACQIGSRKNISANNGLQRIPQKMSILLFFVLSGYGHFT